MRSFQIGDFGLVWNLWNSLIVSRELTWFLESSYRNFYFKFAKTIMFLGTFREYFFKEGLAFLHSKFPGTSRKVPSKEILANLKFQSFFESFQRALWDSKKYLKTFCFLNWQNHQVVQNFLGRAKFAQKRKIREILSSQLKKIVS